MEAEMRPPLALALLLLPASALAQTPDTLVVPGPEVVVHALRGSDRLRDIPAPAFVISRETLQRTAQPRLSSVLQWLPGLNAYQSGATGEPSVVDPRGFTANGETSYLKVLVNGRETRDLENGNVDWDWIGPESVDRMEVVEGAGAWAYGDGSEGGIVNIVRDEWRSGLQPRGLLRFGSFDQRGGSLSANWGADPWGTALGGGGRDVDGWRDHSAERIRNGHGRMSWKSGTSTIALDGGWLSADREDPGALTPDEMAADRNQSETPWDYVNSDRGNVSLDLTHGEAARGQWSLTPYYRSEDFRQVRTLFFTPLYHPTNGSTWGADLGWRRTFTMSGRPLQLAASYMPERGTLNSRYYDFDGVNAGAQVARGEAWRTTQSGSVTARLDLTPGIVARAGTRYDAIHYTFRNHFTGAPDEDQDMSAPSPFVSLSMHALSAGNVYASISGGFHAPTLSQLFDQRPFFFGPPPPIFISNSDLQPQRSIDYEVGGRWDGPSGASALLNLYTIFVRDEIDFDLSTFSYDNIGKSRHTGALAAWRLPLERAVTAMFSGTWSPTTISGGPLEGNQINAVPLGSAAGRLEWSPAAWGSLNGGVRWVARQYLDKENEHPLADYTTADLGMMLRHGMGRLDVQVLNLFDRKYADTGFMDVDASFQPVERLSPAAGRAVTVALGVN
jgi:outer membrane receptor protein involved in Fe transport